MTLLLLAALVAPSYAQSYSTSDEGSGCGLMGCIQMATAGQAVPVAAMHDMEGGRWVLQVAPAYWKIDAKLNSDGPDSDVRVETKGLGVSASLKREFSKHWGGGVLASFTTGKDIELGAKDSGLGNNSISSGPGGPLPPAAFRGPGGVYKDHHSHFVAAMVTWDPFANPDGFRMPVSVGPAYFWQGITYEGRSSTAKIERNTPGLFLNASLDFLVRDFRIMPGILFVLMGGTSDYGSGGRIDYDYVTPSGTFKGAYDAPDNSGSIYTTFQYRPWNLGFNFTLPVLDLKQATVYSVTWTRKWGS